MAFYSILQDLFPWERGLGTRKVPPQFAGASGECAATFWQLKRGWKRLPRAPDQQERAVRQGAASWDAEVAGMGCSRQTLPTTLAHTLPDTALFLGSSAPRIIVKRKASQVSGTSSLSSNAAKHPRCPHSSALVASPPSSGPSHACAVLRAPRNTWP